MSFFTLDGGEKPLVFLEHFPEIGGPVHRIKLDPLPFRIGRDPANNFVVHSTRVSKRHAELRWADDKLLIQDLGSTNGTFHNGTRIKEATLRPGDIVHIDHKEFRVSSLPGNALHETTEDAGTERVSRLETPASLIRAKEMVQSTLRNRQVHIVFQPIVHLDTEEIVAFESLGRCNNPEIGPNPGELLGLAEKCELATEISRLWRNTGFLEAAAIPGRLAFFFNVHPAELLDESMLESLAAIAAHFAIDERRLILEISERTVASLADISHFQLLLRGMGIGLAFDDFGTGQTRLHEMAESPPEYIKIDMKLIRGIDQSPRRQDVVRAIVEVAGRLDIKVIAEGVETKLEADTCRRLGCTFAQGFHFGRPMPASNFNRGGGKTSCSGDPRLQRRLNEIFMSRQQSKNSPPPVTILS